VVVSYGSEEVELESTGQKVGVGWLNAFDSTRLLGRCIEF
jgi:hypothetical protein